MRKRGIYIICVGLFISVLGPAILYSESGGILMPQQVAYDVTYYALDLIIEPEKRTNHQEIDDLKIILLLTPKTYMIENHTTIIF